MKRAIKTCHLLFKTSMVMMTFRTTSSFMAMRNCHHHYHLSNPLTYSCYRTNCLSGPWEGPWNEMVPLNYQRRLTYSTCSPMALSAKPKSGSVVDSYQTVSVNCSKCKTKLFRYKKRNGTKSNLVKCYIERIAEDSAGVLAVQESSGLALEEFSWICPGCQTQFARSAQIHGRPALKMVGGKVRMTKK